MHSLISLVQKVHKLVVGGVIFYNLWRVEVAQGQLCFIVLNEVFGDGKGCAKGPRAQGGCWVKFLFLSDRTDFSVGWRRNLNGYWNVFVQSKQK